MKKILKNNEIKEALVAGNILTMNSPEALAEPRYYRYNNKKLQYSDDMSNWKDSNLNIEDSTEEFLIVK